MQIEEARRGFYAALFLLSYKSASNVRWRRNSYFPSIIGRGHTQADRCWNTCVPIGALAHLTHCNPGSAKGCLEVILEVGFFSPALLPDDAPTNQ
jgi:hypothetical protein